MTLILPAGNGEEARILSRDGAVFGLSWPCMSYPQKDCDTGAKAGQWVEMERLSPIAFGSLQPLPKMTYERLLCVLNGGEVLGFFQ